MKHKPIDWAGVSTRRAEYRPGVSIFRQGDDCHAVLFLEQGSARISVVSHAGKEAVVATLHPGDFFGEGCLAGHPKHIATATTVAACTVVEIEAKEMTHQLHTRPALAERFLSHMLTRNIRIEEDLIDHLFNDAEKRLARVLLLLARYGEGEAAHRTIPWRVADDIGGNGRDHTVRVNTFMNKFRKLGFIEYNGSLKVNHSLLTVLLLEVPAAGSPGASPDRATRPSPGLSHRRKAAVT